MNIETLAQLLEKTDFYRPLGQISEEMIWTTTRFWKDLPTWPIEESS